MKRPLHVTIAAMAMLAASASLLITLAISWPSSRVELTGLTWRSLRIMLETTFGALVGMSISGVSTAIGLLGLGRWARASALVLSVLLVSFPALVIASWEVFIVRHPEPGFAVRMSGVNFGQNYLWLLLPLWWLILFTRPSVRRQFATPEGTNLEGREA